ncbi:MAG: ribosome biogenesis GTPase Der [Vicinamibacterales bacterium]|nr:ribosome biogenesis GTPase Der [Vicinamibacterales bacterium]
MTTSRLPSVVLVGRPNVGKSTLFNRMTGTRRSIVAPVAGTTRDVITHAVVSDEIGFMLTDTGGMFGASQDPLHELVVARGRRALAEAELLIFVTDGREGLAHGDEDIARAVREAGVPTILVINKVDDRRAEAGTLELHRLGFDPVFEVSAEHGRGVGEVIEEIVRRIPRVVRTTTEAEAIRDPHAETSRRGGPAEAPDEVAVAIVGRPNAGKSSLVNRLLREERMIVSEMPGTTRDAVDAVLTWHRRKFRIVDTAGIRKAGRVARSGAVEMVSVLLARRAIEQADIVVLVVDATEGVTDQDAAIVGEAQKAGRGIILCANKWDLMKDQGPDTAKAWDEKARYQLKFLDYAPILHVSAATGERTPKLLQTVDRISTVRHRRVPTPALNKFIERITSAHLPVTPGQRRVRVLYAAQTGVAPPTFVLFTNIATTLHFSYERFLENQLRAEYGFEGTPIRIHVRRRGKERERAKAGPRTR